MTIQTLLAKGGHRLRMSDIDRPESDAELLLAHAMDKPREFLIMYPERAVPSVAAEKFEKLLERRRGHEPIAYLLGYKEFYGRSFGVDRNVLIPRPETETLIEAALNGVASLALRTETLAILDIGTGSGCIALTLVAELPGAHAVAVDVSPEAIAVAEENALRLGLGNRAAFSLLDIASPDARMPDLPPHDALLLAANLPYLPDFTWETSARGIREHEPIRAFVSGADGLNHYRALLRRLDAWASVPDLMLFEADPPQFAPLANLVQGAFKDHRLSVRKDLRGLDRVLVAMRR